MKAVRRLIRRLLRGPRASAVLASLGIDARRFWLLVDLFGDLSDRAELFDQLGRNGMALKTAAWMYFAMSALMSVAVMVARPPLWGFASASLGITAVLLLCVLMMETANSLVNPTEAAALAHQPISGATYTAAKLTHLATVVLYLVPGLAAAPALAGLTLRGAPWFFPFAHLGAALAVGFGEALVCCALFGWMIRFVPTRRLKSLAQLLGVMPFALMYAPQLAGRRLARLHLSSLLPAQPVMQFAVVAAAIAVVLAMILFGLRSLSADYLIRVSAMTRGGAAGGSRSRRSWLGGIVARWFGGQGARAGFAFTSRMMRRDWQFRRQVLPMTIPTLFGVVPLIASGWREDPFLGKFTPAHMAPHLFGIALFMICSLMPYGNDYKGAWVFQLAPPGAFDRFARGVHALLWIGLVLLPNAILLAVLGWSWGVWHGGLFVAYGTAVTSLYLALELRLITGAPFSAPLDPTRGTMMLPTLILGGMGSAAAVGVQYYLIFRSPAIVLAAIVVVGAAAWVATRASLRAFAASIRYHLGLASAESGTLYKEVD